MRVTVTVLAAITALALPRVRVTPVAELPNPLTGLPLPAQWHIAGLETRIDDLERGIADQQDCWDRYEMLRTDIIGVQADMLLLEACYRITMPEIAELNQRLEEAGL